MCWFLLPEPHLDTIVIVPHILLLHLEDEGFLGEDIGEPVLAMPGLDDLSVQYDCEVHGLFLGYFVRFLGEVDAGLDVNENVHLALEETNPGFGPLHIAEFLVAVERLAEGEVDHIGFGLGELDVDVLLHNVVQLSSDFVYL